MTDHSHSNLRGLYSRLRDEAEHLAGAPEDMAPRARAHLQIWLHSGGNHAFPLLAAHGALWGARHIRRGTVAGNLLSLLSGNPGRRRREVADFTRALQTINRDVFIETYVTYHLTRLVGDGASEIIGHSLTEQLCRCHDALRDGAVLLPDEHRALFEAILQNEQDNVVAPRIADAVADLDWRFLRAIALRPPVRFSYFRTLEVLLFKSLDAKSERLKNGLTAYEIAVRRGWETVALSLGDYPEPRARSCRICTRLCPA